MSFVCKTEGNPSPNDNTASYLISLAKEIALSSYNLIIQNNTEKVDRCTNENAIIEHNNEKEDTPGIKSSFLNKKYATDNNTKMTTFQSKKANITIKENEEKEEKPINTKSRAKTSAANAQLINNSPSFRKKTKEKNNTVFNKSKTVNNNTGLRKMVAEASDELFKLDNSLRVEEENATNIKMGKLTLYEKGMRSIDYRKAKINDKRNKQIESIENTMNNIPEITNKSQKMVEKLKDYSPLYLRAYQLHSNKKTKINNEQMLNKLIKEEERNDCQMKKEEEKISPKQIDAFITRQEKWHKYNINKTNALKFQHETIGYNNKKKSKSRIQSQPKVNWKKSYGNDSVFIRLHIDNDQHKARQQYRNKQYQCSFQPSINNKTPSFIKNKPKDLSHNSSSKSINTNANYFNAYRMQTKTNYTSNKKLFNRKLSSFSLTRNNSKDQLKVSGYDKPMHNSNNKSRNLNKSAALNQFSGKKTKKNKDYVITQYNYAANNITHNKLQSNKLSKSNIDNNTTNFSLYNHYVSGDDNMNQKPKQSVFRSTSNISSFIGIPQMLINNINIVGQSIVNIVPNRYSLSAKKGYHLPKSNSCIKIGTLFKLC